MIVICDIITSNPLTNLGFGDGCIISIAGCSTRKKITADDQLTLPKNTGQLTTEADKRTIKCGLMWVIHMYI